MTEITLPLKVVVLLLKSNAKRTPPMTTVLSYLPFKPTQEQAAALNTIEEFLSSDDDFLIVRGAAGSGKTSIMSALTRYSEAKGILPVLLGPTGRAAKNLGRKTASAAKTVHSCLYTPQADPEEAIVHLQRRTNECQTPQLFLTDESSLISDRLNDKGMFVAQNSLLHDLIAYIRQGHSQNKVIFIGDSCQLPPVGYQPHELAPALTVAHLHQKYQLRGQAVELSQVMRQNEGSPILKVAYQLRQNIQARRLATPKQIGTFYKGEESAVALYLNRFVLGVHDRVAILSLTNTYRDACNKLIRSRLGLQGKIALNDTVVLAQTHFGQHYVASGELGVVKALGSRLHRVADLEFVEAEISFKDEREQAFSIESLVLLNSLGGTITQEQRQKLFASEMRYNEAFRESKDLRSSRYLSALQLNYGHALTVHKAQGSEWDTVIMNTWMRELDLRFLYTGITRARSELFTNSAHQYA
jgi:exodeoxyribonuclease-5